MRSPETTLHDKLTRTRPVLHGDDGTCKKPKHMPRVDQTIYGWAHMRMIEDVAYNDGATVLVDETFITRRNRIRTPFRGRPAGQAATQTTI